jgi:hypothetical protein
MAEIDPVAFKEIAITFFLNVQLVLAAIVAGLGYYCGRRKRPTWVRAGFLLSLVLATAVGGLTLYSCWDTSNYIQSRRDDPLRYERIKDDLEYVREWAWSSGALLAATVGGGALLYRLARSGRDVVAVS